MRREQAMNLEEQEPEKNIFEMLEEIRSENRGVNQDIVNGLIELIEVANQRHEKAMLKKDIEIAKLQGYIKGLEQANKGLTDAANASDK